MFFLALFVIWYCSCFISRAFYEFKTSNKTKKKKMRKKERTKFHRGNRLVKSTPCFFWFSFFHLICLRIPFNNTFSLGFWNYSPDFYLSPSFFFFVFLSRKSISAMQSKSRLSTTLFLRIAISLCLLPRRAHRVRRTRKCALRYFCFTCSSAIIMLHPRQQEQKPWKKNSSLLRKKDASRK